jgi:hypothetical protein
LSIAFYLLTILLAATPVLAIANGALVQHAVALAAAITLAIAAMGPEAQISSIAPLLKRFSLAILFPVFWMILQTIPLPFSSLANPIWSTTDRFNEASLPGRISVDPGATLRTLIFYLINVSLVVATVIITKDRHRAETILFVLCAVTTFMSVEVLLGRLDLFARMIPGADAPASPYPATAAFAVLANCALVARTIERHLHQQDISNLLSAPLWSGLLSGPSGITLALAAMTILGHGNL